MHVSTPQEEASPWNFPQRQCQASLAVFPSTVCRKKPSFRFASKTPLAADRSRRSKHVLGGSLDWYSKLSGSCAPVAPRLRAASRIAQPQQSQKQPAVADDLGLANCRGHFPAAKD